MMYTRITLDQNPHCPLVHRRRINERVSRQTAQVDQKKK